MLLTDELRNWFPEMDHIPGEDSVKIVERTTKELDYFINVVDKTTVGFGRTGSNFERSSAAGKML